MAKFMTPVIQDNPSGWGPCAVPEQFRDMPYQPFSKGDRLGKVLSCQQGSESFNLWLLLQCSFQFYALKSIRVVSIHYIVYIVSIWILPVVIGETGS